MEVPRCIYAADESQANCTVESWAADRAIEHIRCVDGRPFFGFLSFIGPHPPLAPLYLSIGLELDRMPNPVRGELEIDHMDEQIPWMNYSIWAEGYKRYTRTGFKARYYGEISYIDQCLGRVLDAVEGREDGQYSDMLFCRSRRSYGRSHAWQRKFL